MVHFYLTIYRGGIDTLICSRTLITLNPPPRIEKSAEDLTIFCDDNIESKFSIWLDNLGGMKIWHCSNVLIRTTEPEFPKLIYSCSGTAVSDVLFRVRDHCGIWVENSARFQVLDTLSPELICKDLFTIDISKVQKIQDLEAELYQGIDASEQCGAISFSHDFDISSISNDCNQNQIFIIHVIATDDCANSSSCDITIEITNTNSPEIQCPPPIYLDCENPYNSTLIENWLSQANAADFLNSNIEVSNDFSISSLNTNCGVIQKITFLCKDQCGRTNTCNSELIIYDNLAPEIICPPHMTINISEQNKDIIIQNWKSMAESQDNCNSAEISDDFNPDDLEFQCKEDHEIAVIFRSTDTCENVSTCNSIIHIVNDYTVNIDCTESLILECGNPNNLTFFKEWVNSVYASDNLGNKHPVENDLSFEDLSFESCHDSYIINFLYSDICGQLHLCTNSIAIHDYTPPFIQCPEDFEVDESVFLNENYFDDLLNGVSTNDNCGKVDISYLYQNLGAPDCENYHHYAISLQATDECDLTSDCNFNIYRQVDLNPTIKCAETLSMNCDESKLDSIINNWLTEVQAYDNSGDILVGQNNFDPSQIHNHQCEVLISVEFSVHDECNRTMSCNSSIEILDTNPPILLCPEKLNLNSTDSNHQNKILDWLNNYSAQDACNEIDVSWDFIIEAFNICDSEVNILVEYLVEDVCYNRTHCTTSIVLNDQPPIINCPDILILECGELDSKIKIDFWLDKCHGSDNSGVELKSYNNFDVSALVSVCEKVIEVEFTVEDACLKNTKCKSSIKIIDTEAPEITCPDDKEVNIPLESDWNSLLEWLQKTETKDNCGEVTIKNDFSISIHDIECSETHIVTFRAIDECNNASKCTSSIFFNRIETPQIVCPDYIELQCSSENVELIISEFMTEYEVSSELEYEVFVDIDYLSLDLQCTEAYTQIIEFTVIDNCNNEDRCQTHISLLPELKIYIPTIFSASLTKPNNRFTVYGNSMVKNVKQLIIYDRWGNVIFANNDFPPNDSTEGWDGTNIESGPEISSVYTYYTVVEDYFMQEIEFIGTITLVK